MPEKKSLCVFCGSATGNDPRFSEATVLLGTYLAAEDVTLVYGGAAVGQMGLLADTVLGQGGEVIGVIPESDVIQEVAHPGLTATIRVGSMHDRKAVMGKLGHAFLALPGGLGTLEELFEVLTWAQLRLHKKPVGLLNVAGYYNPLLQFLDESVAKGFVKPQHRALLIAEDSLQLLLPQLLGLSLKA